MNGEPRSRLRSGDRARIGTSVLFAVLGAVILVRAALLGMTSPNAYLMGAAIAGLGLYRLWLVRRTLSGAGGQADDGPTKER